MENNTDIFWFSLRNLARTIRNIMVLFGAVSDDFDEMDAAVTDLNTRVGAVEQSTLDPSVTSLEVYHALMDNGDDDILDNEGNTIESTTFYQRV